MKVAPGIVQAIYLAAKAGEELVPAEAARLEAGRGVPGDRYHGHVGTFSERLKDSRDWEVTPIEREEIDRFNASTGQNLAPGRFRRNIVTTGIRLNDLVGCQFRIGDAVMMGMRLCEPCAHLGTFLGPEVVRAMAHRAGIRARILVGAEVRAGVQIIGGEKT